MSPGGGASRRRVLEGIFADPEGSLGTIERNVEVKVAFLMLWELGWDPVSEIALCFHIRRGAVSPAARAAVAVDLALRDDLGLCAVGEVKQWECRTVEWTRGEDQVRRYQAAVSVPLAFLTCGWRWSVWTEGERRDFENRRDPATLLKELGGVLHRNAKRTPWPNDLWRFGLNPKRQSTGAAGMPRKDPAAKLGRHREDRSKEPGGGGT